MKKVFSIVLSFMLLVSHMSFIVGTHYCGGEPIETKIMLGETHLGCVMMDREEPCDNSEHSNHNQVSFNNVPCCQNEFQTIQGTADFVKEAAQSVFNVDFTVAFIYTTLNLDLFPKSTHQFYTEYISPPLEKDIQVLFQTFLI
ncbi:MAG: hypothetical protein CVU09_07175 [Bacteroidetes bacterium HGW-Bacteroidetes-4]|jgi:hypothetical protein|nr:MAG: hypothetical protein CVU09_07175 [Bacteroidetes bacterium HGW-Bacteroidetes-4]